MLAILSLAAAMYSAVVTWFAYARGRMSLRRASLFRLTHTNDGTLSNTTQKFTTISTKSTRFDSESMDSHTGIDTIDENLPTEFDDSDASSGTAWGAHHLDGLWRRCLRMCCWHRQSARIHPQTTTCPSEPPVAMAGQGDCDGASSRPLPPKPGHPLMWGSPTVAPTLVTTTTTSTVGAPCNNVHDSTTRAVPTLTYAFVPSSAAEMAQYSAALEHNTNPA